MFEQDLFFKNLFDIDNKTSSFAKAIIKNSFLKHYKTPHFVFTGTNYINFDRFCNNKHSLNLLSKHDQIDIFLFEPLSYCFKNQKHNLGFYSEFDHRLNSNTNLRADELESISKLQRKIGKENIRVNLCDYRLPKQLKNYYSPLELVCRDLFLRSVSSRSTLLKLKSTACNIKKTFWCGNGRYTIHRHMIMCKLAKYSGNYSWFFEAKTDWKIENTWIKNIDIFELEQGNKILNKENFSLDFNMEKTKIGEINGFYKPEYNYENRNIEYKKTFDECFVAIINETRFAQPSANFSEKTLDAVTFHKPFIVVAPPRTLEYFRSMGFRTFSDFWDETYDIIENHSERMNAIFNLIDEIASWDIEKCKQIYEKMMPILHHNAHIRKNLQMYDAIAYEK